MYSRKPEMFQDLKNIIQEQTNSVTSEIFKNTIPSFNERFYWLVFFDEGG